MNPLRIACCLPLLLLVAAADGPPAVAYLGIAAKGAPASAGLPEGLGLAVTFANADGPAAAAGVRAGDVLHKLDDQLLCNAAQMVTLVQLRKPGDTVTLTLLRGRQTIKVAVTLGGRPRPPAGGGTPPAPIPAAVPDDEPTPTLPGVAGPIDPLAPGRGTVVRYADATYAATVTTDAAGHRQMVVTTADGNRRVAAGPVDTAEQWAKFPADVRQHLQAVQRVLAGKP